MEDIVHLFHTSQRKPPYSGVNHLSGFGIYVTCIKEVGWCSKNTTANWFTVGLRETWQYRASSVTNDCFPTKFHLVHTCNSSYI